MVTMNDEPYRPCFNNEEDETQVMHATGASRSGSGIDPARIARWNSSRTGQGGSLLAPLDGNLAELVASAELKLARGKTLSPREARILAYQGAIRLLRSRRPAAVAAGAQILTRLDQQRTEEGEDRRRRREERKRKRAERDAMTRFLRRGSTSGDESGKVTR